MIDKRLIEYLDKQEWLDEWRASFESDGLDYDDELLEKLWEILNH